MSKIFFSPRVYLPVLIVVMVLVWMFSKNFGRSSPNSNDSAIVAQKQTEVTRPLQKVLVQSVKNSSIHKTLTLQGEVMPIRRVDIKSETMGKVAMVLVKRGQRVNAGQILLTLDQEERKLKYEQAQSELDSAILDYNANEKLVLQGAKSKAQFETMKAVLSRAKANLETARLELSRTDITAPFGGIVENTPPELGQLLRVGDLVVSILDVNPLIVRAFVPQTDIAELTLQTTGVATLLTGEVFTGKIHNISPSAQNNSRTFEIKFALDTSDKIPLLGMSARLVLDLNSILATEVSPAIVSLATAPKVAVATPSTSHNKSNGLIVKAVDSDGKVQYIPVEHVKTSSSNLWVSGIPDGTNIITRGAGFVAEHEKVEAITQEAADNALTARKNKASTDELTTVPTKGDQP